MLLNYIGPRGVAWDVFYDFRIRDWVHRDWYMYRIVGKCWCQERAYFQLSQDVQYVEGTSCSYVLRYFYADRPGDWLTEEKRFATLDQLEKHKDWSDILTEGVLTWVEEAVRRSALESGVTRPKGNVIEMVYVKCC